MAEIVVLDRMLTSNQQRHSNKGREMHMRYLPTLGWLDSLVVRALDSRLHGRGQVAGSIPGRCDKY